VELGCFIGGMFLVPSVCEGSNRNIITDACPWRRNGVSLIHIGGVNNVRDCG
jgi:hypothetical protein